MRIFSIWRILLIGGVNELYDAEEKEEITELFGRVGEREDEGVLEWKERGSIGSGSGHSNEMNCFYPTYGTGMMSIPHSELYIVVHIHVRFEWKIKAFMIHRENIHHHEL